MGLPVALFMGSGGGGLVVMFEGFVTAGVAFCDWEFVIVRMGVIEAARRGRRAVVGRAGVG